MSLLVEIVEIVAVGEALLEVLAPRDFYAVDMLPALERTLDRALEGIEAGRPRHIPQVERYATYDRAADLDK